MRLQTIDFNKPIKKTIIINNYNNICHHLSNKNQKLKLVVGLCTYAVYNTHIQNAMYNIATVLNLKTAHPLLQCHTAYVWYTFKIY